MVVSKLAALLRVADALIRGHRRRAADIRFQRQGDELIVTMPAGDDLLLEERRPCHQGRPAGGHLRGENQAGGGVDAGGRLLFIKWGRIDA